VSAYILAYIHAYENLSNQRSPVLLSQASAAYVDFANTDVGGTFLGAGFVQEEILVLEHTEMVRCVFVLY
jgi:hypothetical protein